MTIKQTGNLQLPKLSGVEISPGIVIVGEPRPVPGTSKIRALANVRGTLCLVELRLTFLKPGVQS